MAAASSAGSGREHRRAVVESYRPIVESKRVQFAPDISAKKLVGAVGAYGEGLVDPAEVLVLVDTTLFGGARDGALVTPTALHTHELMGKPVHLRYDEIRSLRLDGSKLAANGDRQLLDLGVLDEKAAVVELLHRVAGGEGGQALEPDRGSALPRVEPVSLDGETVHCGICSNVRPAARTHVIHTAIDRFARAHTAEFKTYATRSQSNLLLQERAFGICESCCRRQRRRNQVVLVSAAAALAFWAVQWLVLHNLTGWQFLWPFAITVVAAGGLSGRFADSEEAMKRRAVKERKVSAEAEVARLPRLMPEYPRADLSVTVVGYNEAEYERLLKKLEKRR